MILVTGASGQLGRLVITALLEKLPASEIVAGVRTPARAEDLAALGVQVRHVDYDEAATLDAALAGVDKVLLISSSEVGRRVAQHSAVVDAALRAGVKLLAYTSILRAETSPLILAQEHRDTETVLRASGLPFALLRNGWYTENYTGSIPSALERGVIVGSAGEGRISLAARADYAAAAAAVLTSEEDQTGKVYELAGDGAYTKSELAAEVAKQSGEAVAYKNVPGTEYQALLESVGLPQELASILADSDLGASKNALLDESRQLSHLIGRPTTSLASTVAASLKG